MRYSCPSLETMPLAIVTGANTGLGFEVARALSAKGLDVLIASRNLENGERAVAALKKARLGASVSTLPLDLSSMRSIERFVKQVNEKFGSWGLLVNNAGAKVLSSYSETEFGVEYHFGVNAVGHFALTLELLPIRNNNSRVVTVASIVARSAPTELGPSGSATSYNPGQSYSASKLSNVAFAIELQNRLGSENFKSLAAHPGFAKAQPYGSKATRFFESVLAQSASSGALPIIEAATNPEVPGGAYLGPKILELWGKAAEAKIPNSINTESLKENWRILELLSGRKLVV